MALREAQYDKDADERPAGKQGRDWGREGLRHSEETPMDDDGAKPLSDDEQAKLDGIEKNFDEDAPESSSFYQPDDDSDGGGGGKSGRSLFNLNKNKSKLKGPKKWLKKKSTLIVAAFGGLLVIIMIAIFLFLSSLKLPHMVANISVYEFARLSRNFSQSASDVTEEKIAIDAEGSFAQSVKTKWGDLRSKTWGKLDKYRPQKVLDNLNSTKQLEYVFTEEPRTIFPGTKQVLTGVKINGEVISFSDAKWFQFGQRYTDRLEFNGRLTAQIESALKESNTLVRGSVAQKIRDELGIKLRRWERLTTPYKDALDAERDAIRTTAKVTSTTADNSAVDAVADGVTEAQKLADDTLADDAKLNQFIASDGQSLATETDAVVTRTTTEALTSTAAKILGAASTIYGIAVPACMIYDGSVENSKSVVDANSDKSVKMWHTIASAAHQQEVGSADQSLDPSQIGGLNDEIGDISNSPGELRTTNQLTSTSSFPNPQAGGAQYTILDVIFGGAIGGFFSDVIGSHCRELTSISTGAALAAAEIAAAALTGGTSAGAEASISAGIRAGLTDIFKEAFTKKFALKVLRDVTLIEAGTFLAKLLVISHMANQSSGIPTGDDMEVQADQGANISAGEVDRQQFYGRPMTPVEVAVSNYQDYQDVAFKNSQKSVFERYLSPSNPTSAATNVAMSVDGVLRGSLLTTMRGLFTKLGAAFQPNGALLSNLIGGNQKRALAATAETNYHIVQWGWTQEEENVIAANPDLYSPVNNAEFVERQMDLTAVKAKYDECFTASIGTLLSEKKIVRDADGNVLPGTDKGLCSPDNLSYKNSEAFRYRLYMRYEGTIDQLDGIQDLTPVARGAAAPTSTPGTGPVDCSTAVGNDKIVCAGKTLLGVRYANYNAGGTDWNAFWGVTVQGSLGQRPAQWLAQRVIGGNNDFMECSGFTKTSIYVAFGVTVNASCSANYRTDTQYFRVVDFSEAKSGDLLIESDVCGNGGHIGIFLGITDTGTFSSLESASTNNTAGEKETGYYERPQSAWKYVVRYIGPGSTP